jgi:hypothetical protein
MPKQQPNGTPGKKPPTPSVKVRRGDFYALVEILKGQKPRQPDDAESGQPTTVSKRFTAQRTSSGTIT